eukprot:69287_1
MMSNGASVLIGSQLSTYHTLIQMGFAESDSVTVSQIFGSNLAGAINCILTGNVSNLRITMTPAKLIENVNINQINSRIPTFRVTPMSYTLITGYIRINESKDIIPTVIKHIIIKYVNFYFIKLNYNINTNDHIQNDEYDSKTDNTISIYVLKENKSLRNIAIEIESTLGYKYNELSKRMDYVNPVQYSYFVHLWMRYCYLKYIYPITNDKIKINMNMIDDCMENKEDEYRWVEIPNDFEEITIYELHKLISTINKKQVIELGIEIFEHNTKQWPFRHQKQHYSNIHLNANGNVSVEARNVNKKGAATPQELLKQFLEKEAKLNDLDSVIYDLLIEYGFETVQSLYVLTEDDLKVIGIQTSTDRTQLLKAIEKEKSQHKPTDVSVTVTNKWKLFRIISNWYSDIHFSSKLTALFLQNHTQKTVVKLLSAPNILQVTIDRYANELCNADNYISDYHCVDWICVNCNTKNEKFLVICCGCFCCSVSIYHKWILSLRIGDFIDVKDEQNKWYESVIRYIGKKNNQKILLYIHYIGWGSKWDEILDVDLNHNRMAKRNTYSIRAHMTKETHYKCKPEMIYPNYNKCD